MARCIDIINQLLVYIWCVYLLTTKQDWYRTSSTFKGKKLVHNKVDKVFLTIPPTDDECWMKKAIKVWKAKEKNCSSKRKALFTVRIRSITFHMYVSWVMVWEWSTHMVLARRLRIVLGK